MTDTPDGSVTTTGYDHLGEVTSSSDAYTDTSTFDYDDQGQLQDAYKPDGTFETYGHDQAGRLTAVTDYPASPGGQAVTPLRSESFGYDQDGNQTSADDWNQNTTSSVYNAADELTSQTMPVSSAKSITTSYGYDAAGNRTSAVDGV